MRTMSALNRLEIAVFGKAKPRSAAMNQQIMHQKIGQAIQCNTETEPKWPSESVNPYEHTRDARRGKDEKEKVILLKVFAWAWLVVILVP